MWIAIQFLNCLLFSDESVGRGSYDKDEEDDNDDNPDRALCRYEFMEIMCRIADYKYKKKAAVTLSQGLEILI